MAGGCDASVEGHWFAACGEEELGGDLTVCATTKDKFAEEKKPAQVHRETWEHVALRETLTGRKGKCLHPGSVKHWEETLRGCDQKLSISLGNFGTLDKAWF